MASKRFSRDCMFVDLKTDKNMHVKNCQDWLRGTPKSITTREHNSDPLQPHSYVRFLDTVNKVLLSYRDRRFQSSKLQYDTWSLCAHVRSLHVLVRQFVGAHNLWQSQPEIAIQGLVRIALVGALVRVLVTRNIERVKLYSIYAQNKKCG